MSPNEILDFKAQAGGANANIDEGLITRVVDAMVAKMTERANIQALVDPPDNLPCQCPRFPWRSGSNDDAARADFSGQEHQEPGFPDGVLPDLER